MKVIHILPYSSLVTSRDFKVDLFADGYHARAAQQIWKRTQKYQLECWRPERKLKAAITGEKGGIIYRAFPSFRPTLGGLDQVVYKNVMATFPSARWGLWREYSIPMLKELKKQCQQEEVLVHFCHLCDLSYLSCLYIPDVPIVAWRGGGAPYTYSVHSFVYHLPLSLIERKALGRIDKILLGSRWDYDVFYHRFRPDTIEYVPLGVDFELFRPLGKQEARETLDISMNKKVILHVGRFDLAKGFDLVLKVYRKLRGDYDVELIAIGGLRTDMLYEEAMKSGARVHEWMSQSELIPYYSAADVYLFPKFYSSKRDENLEEFMGIGTSPLESLACGTPVIGTCLRHFLGTEQELGELGKIPTDPENVAECVSEVFEHPELYQGCREIARKYYSWDAVVDQLVHIYDRLLYKYYK
jgi:glycosyltransferase involved in cell wall biosynthesis